MTNIPPAKDSLPALPPDQPRQPPDRWSVIMYALRDWPTMLRLCLLIVVAGLVIAGARI